MKWMFLLVCWLLIPFVYGQNTYSKIYDVDPDATRNYLHDFEILSDNIFTYSTTFCKIEDSLHTTCVALSKYNLDGDVLKISLLDSLDSQEYCYEGLTKNGQDLFMSTYIKGEKFKQTSVIRINSDLNQLDINKYTGANESSYILNEGIEYIDESLYLYGNVNNHADTPDSVQIIKTDIDGNELGRLYYSYGNSTLEINNFQPTADGNFAFILKIKSPAGANNGFDGFQLMKIDTFGNVLSTFSFEDSDRQPNRILATSDDGYVFSSIDHPFDGHDIFTTGYGLINKMDDEMDTLEWSLVLPNDQLVDGRHYRMYDYMEASNGDIVACGMVYDNTDTELATGVPDKNSTWNGFIIRLSPEGDILWLHLYKKPNDLLPHDEYGRFRGALLKDIKELPDGRLIAAGNVFVNTPQYYGINEFETEAYHLWLLIVDENGCLDGYDCEEIIRINPPSRIGYHRGDTWIYEQENYIGGGNGSVGYESFTIEDTLFDGMHTKYVLSTQDTFYVDDQRMFFWDEYYQEYIMYYDWEASTSYDIKYYEQFRASEEIATVVIDSVSYKHFDEDSLKVQYVRILNSGTIEGDYHYTVYEGVGAGHSGIKFILGCGLCDSNEPITQLRCFINDTMTYQFVPYACDSTWLISGVNEIDAEKINIYPNPTSGEVQFKGIDHDIEYEVYTIDGRLVDKGKTIDRSVELEKSGLYLLKFKIDENWHTVKIVKLE